MMIIEKMGEKGQTFVTEDFQLLNVETVKEIGFLLIIYIQFNM